MRKADVYTKMENLTSSENFLRSQKKFNLSKCLCQPCSMKMWQKKFPIFY